MKEGLKSLKRVRGSLKRVRGGLRVWEKVIEPEPNKLELIQTISNFFKRFPTISNFFKQSNQSRTSKF